MKKPPHSKSSGFFVAALLASCRRDVGTTVACHFHRHADRLAKGRVRVTAEVRPTPRRRALLDLNDRASTVSGLMVFRSLRLYPTQTRRSAFSRTVVQPNPTSPKLPAPKRPPATSPNRPIPGSRSSHLVSINGAPAAPAEWPVFSQQIGTFTALDQPARVTPT